MLQWIKLFGNQYIGFWSLGAVLFVLQEIPYAVMPLLKLESNPIMHLPESSILLNALEKVLGSLCIALMLFVVRGDGSFFDIGGGIHKVGFVLAMVVLLLNYIGWGIYFRGFQSVGIMLFFIVLLPPLYYICIGLWRGNGLLCVAGVVFGIIHFLHTYGNLKMYGK